MTSELVSQRIEVVLKQERMIKDDTEEPGTILDKWKKGKGIWKREVTL
jgi:hypothetical protein